MHNNNSKYIMDLSDIINDGIDKRIIEVFSKDTNKDYSIREVATIMGYDQRKYRNVVKAHIMAMTSQRILVKEGTRFMLNAHFVEGKRLPKHYTTGTVEVNAMGKVSVASDDGNFDIKINSSNTMNALDGDRVKVYLFPQRKGRRREGQIVEIIKRLHEVFAGTIHKQGKGAFVSMSDNYMPVDIYVPQCDESIEDGQKVIVRLISWPEGKANPQGEITKVLGAPGDNEVEMQSILIDNDFQADFPKDVLQQADKIPSQIPQEEIENRKDYRDIMTFTIDPKDAKDFDDALSIEILDNEQYRIGVHIADVSYYVHKGDAIDEQAYQRATSVYLVDRTIPMLPEKLCNEVCSLREGEDSLCFSVMFTFNKYGYVLEYSVDKSIIHSNRRFCYEQVQQVIEQQEGEKAEYILPLWNIAKQLRNRRFRRGTINFDAPEFVFDLDENKKPIGIHLKESKEANWLVEEYMLLANKTIAEMIGKKKNGQPSKTFVYRVHDEPNNEKVETFKVFASKLGYNIENTSRKRLVSSYNALFEQVKGKAEQTLLSNIALRTMSKAYYSTDNIGHYGLSFNYYTHFTSPIRRYPDLMVHRLLFDYLNGQPSRSKDEYEEYCEHCSTQEKKAASAEHESVKYKQAEYLSDKVGQEFDGEVSGVCKWGIYVMIEDNHCEGLVRMNTLSDDFYVLDEDNYQIVGKDSGNTYQLGQKVRIKVQGVNLVKKQMAFLIVPTKEE